MSAATVAARVKNGEVTAGEVLESALGEIAARDSAIGSFSSVLPTRARADAARVDAAIAAGADVGPLAGVPFAVKNLFDVAGEVTLAGSLINRDDPPAVADATAVAMLRDAGAVLCGSLSMDEYAYGFTTENAHYGSCHNPRDVTRISGGSSGGSAAAVAAGLVPLALGSDTNGSIRVPAALCGVWGFKPTFGAVPRDGMFPFCDSLDHVGVVAETALDLALAARVLGRFKHASWDAPRVVRAGGYFTVGADRAALEAVDRVAAQLDVSQQVELEGARGARAAAMLITAAEAAAVHLERLRARAGDFDPQVGPRLIAGSLIPADLYRQAQDFRVAFRERVRCLFEDVDVIIAAATPFAAPPIGQRTVVLDAVGEVEVRSYLGAFTQPLSFVGLPVVVVPVSGTLPLGVQLIAAPGDDAKLLDLASRLEDL